MRFSLPRSRKGARAGCEPVWQRLRAGTSSCLESLTRSKDYALQGNQSAVSQTLLADTILEKK